ncbi:MAG: uroporphyrinogen decarboxylase [Planctomycetes bacterium]|nr:uroporphyrinogen decarboxylase [Planctomycetota bacterium]
MNDLFLRACRREVVPRTPVWLMRQAGRYLPEYREIRRHHDFLAMTRLPEVAAEVTLQPVRRFGLDAAILFADILTPLAGAGIGIEFTPGPVVARPVRSGRDLEPLRRFDAAAAVPETLQTIRLLRERLEVPLIGFAGAPFTLACYLVDGKGSKDFPLTRTLLYREPELAGALFEALVDLTVKYAVAQVRAGAQAIQLFDTWAGLLAPEDFARYVRPYVARIFAALRPLDVPAIYYLNGAAPLAEIAGMGASVAAVDHRTSLAGAREALGATMAVQGNLDPMVLLGPPELVRERVAAVLAAWGGGPGHVFNVGHGLNKETPPENVAVLVEAVRKGSAE